MISSYIIMTEGIALPKLDNLNWWPIWMMKNCSKENTIKTRKKLN